MEYKRLGDVLVSAGVISDEQLSTALKHQKGTNKRLGTVLIDIGILTEQQLIRALELQLGLESIDLSKTVISPEMAHILSKNLAKKHNVVPVRVEKDELFLAMSDPLNFVAIEDVRAATRKRITPVIAPQAAVDRAIMTLYGNEGAARAIEEMKWESAGTPDTSANAATTLDDDSASAPTVRLVNSIIERAVTERASDIHLEPREHEMAVRMRIDGRLRPVLNVPGKLQRSVISRLKVMAAMDISERRVPQDGRAHVKVKNNSIDLRVSTLPTIYGEKVVVRLLDKAAQFLDPAAIGLTGDNYEKYTALLQNASGVTLIVGPTGSGKSSTMYTMIRQLNRGELNLVTLEDPVEYNIDGVNQVQINEKAGMTFAGGLRSILRQDPDIIAVGEIRDGETAEIAMRAAITGHLVLSTVHTNSAVSTIDRLIDIGVEPYLIAEAVRGIISQRLVRRICPSCREEYSPSAEDFAKLRMPPDSAVRLCRGRGCPSCFHTGYRGRVGVFEILVLDHDIKRIIAERRPRQELLDAAQRSGFSSMLDGCRALVLDGVTTADEAFRILNSTED